MILLLINHLEMVTANHFTQLITILFKYFVILPLYAYTNKIFFAQSGILFTPVLKTLCNLD